MCVSLRRIAVLALFGLLGVGVGDLLAQAANAPLPRVQRPPIGFSFTRPSFVNNFAMRPSVVPFNSTFAFQPSGVTAAQFAYNASLIGQGLSNIPPYAFGGSPGISPYAISTLAGGINPYATSAALSTTPGGYGGYSMSTTPYGSYGTPYSNYGYNTPEGSQLQGIASVTAATGQYYQQIGQARITREQARQMEIDTARKMIEFEIWKEKIRPTAPKLIALENQTNLDEARNYASPTKIWSGEALNQLLNSILKSDRLSSARSRDLQEDVLKHINLTDKSSRGNVGLLKDGGSLTWPLVLHEAAFDETRKELGVKLKNAVDQLKELKKVEPRVLRDADTLFKTLSDKVNNSADDLSPAQYIEAKRFLTQVEQAIKALKSPRAANYFTDLWKARGKNVADLIDNMRKEGLEFAPATSGDEAAYNSLYVALRNYEAGLREKETTKE